MTINFLLPGAFDTDRLRSNVDDAAKKQGISAETAFADARRRRCRPGGSATADEFGAACAFLCSAHAGYITGQKSADGRRHFSGAF